MAYFLDILLCAARFTSKSKIPFQASKNDVKENGIGDESMEVDGVKRSPSAPKVPSLKKQASFQSALSVLQQMVNEYDDQGFTPLLLACEMYMNYTKPPKRNNVSLYHLHKCAFWITSWRVIPSLVGTRSKLLLRGRKKDLGNCCTRLKAEDNSFLGLLHTIGQGFDYCLII